MYSSSLQKLTGLFLIIQVVSCQDVQVTNSEKNVQ